MKNISRLAVIICLACLLWPSAFADARSHRFLDLDIEAWVQEDGSVKIAEDRTVRFDGTFRGMYQWIDTSGGISVRDIVVEEKGRPYERNPRTDPGPPGTFFVRKDPDSVYVDWSFSATNETRTFTLRYTLTDAVVVHSDVAELYIQFVGSQWDQPVEDVRVTLHLPPGASKEDIRAWGHGPLHGTVTILDGETVVWEISPLPAKTFLEGRVTFPPRLIPHPTKRSGRAALNSILKEEERWAKQSNLKRFTAALDLALGVLLVLGALVWSVWSWFRWGKEYTPSFQGDYFRELPGQYSPAEMSILYTMGRVSPRDLTATLLDLARRGFISIEEISKESRRLFSHGTRTDYKITRREQDEDKQKNLRYHEKELLTFLFSTVDSEQDGKITFAQIQAFARRRKETFADFWRAWQELAKEEAERHGFFDTSISKRRTWQFAIGAALFLVSIPVMILRWNISGLGLIVSGVILIIGALVLQRRSKYGNEQFAQWKAFRRFLLHFSEMQRHEVPSLVIWEHYLVYAVSLGVAKQVLRQLQLVFPNLQDGDYRFGHGWYYYGALASPGSLEQSLSNLTTSIQNSFQQSIAAATSKTSSGSGGGGGFSSGGGGGVGGGGGGVR